VKSRRKNFLLFVSESIVRTGETTAKKKERGRTYLGTLHMLKK
jgi:hypothetical protein